MAEGEMSEWLDCSICMEQLRAPRALDCLHSFCYDCLQRFPKGRIQCPLCRQVTAKTVDQLPMDFRFHQLFDALLRRDSAAEKEQKIKEFDKYQEILVASAAAKASDLLAQDGCESVQLQHIIAFCKDEIHATYDDERQLHNEVMSRFPQKIRAVMNAEVQRMDESWESRRKLLTKLLDWAVQAKEVKETAELLLALAREHETEEVLKLAAALRPMPCRPQFDLQPRLHVATVRDFIKRWCLRMSGLCRYDQLQQAS